MIGYWNRHSKHVVDKAGTYFEPSAVQAIATFLLGKIGKRNLDLGGGICSEDYARGSTVLDVSDVALKANPSKCKVRFDLEDLNNGVSLPFRQGSFETATMVSVWQYLQNSPNELLKELDRILMGRRKLFIVNSDRLAMPGRETAEFRSKKPDDIIKEIEALGRSACLDYIEHISIYNNDFPEILHCVGVRL